MTHDDTALSIRDAFRGRHVLLTGASGFLGKVFLALLLEHLPDVARVYVLLRSKALVPARGRFEKMLNTSPAFKRLHERYGAQLSELIADRVEVVEGDLSEPDFAAPSELIARLRERVDLVVHCAGLVDFNPDLRKAISGNVDATMHVADFVLDSERAVMLHVSTCYVAGARYGRVEEQLVVDYAPRGEGFDAAREVAAAREAATRIQRDHETKRHQDRVRAEVRELVQARRGRNDKLVESLTRRRLRSDLKRALSEEGMRRARAWGWPNTYTYTKSMAESLLAKRLPKERLSVLRPTIVESALEFPFPGWNESFNGSAPLAYVMGTWFRSVPARPDAPFDVIPVDEVCKAMAIAGGALLERRHASVYQIGTSERHRCSVGRAAELIVLAHRRHYRQRGRSRGEQVFKSRWDAVLVGRRTLTGIESNRSLVRGVREAFDLLPDRLRDKARRAIDRADKADDRLAQIEELVELYLPFMFESFYVFVARAIDRTRALEPELRFEPERIDWRTYWLDVHMPGLRRWAFPLIDGKRPERYRAPHPVSLSDPPRAPLAAEADLCERGLTQRAAEG